MVIHKLVLPCGCLCYMREDGQEILFCRKHLKQAKAMDEDRREDLVIKLLDEGQEQFENMQK